MSKADGGPLSRSGGRSGATAPARWSSGGASLFGLASPKARPGSTSERGIRWSSPRAPASGVETLRRSSRVETPSAFLVRTTTEGGSIGDARAVGRTVVLPVHAPFRWSSRREERAARRDPATAERRGARGRWPAIPLCGRTFFEKFVADRVMSERSGRFMLNEAPDPPDRRLGSSRIARGDDEAVWGVRYRPGGRKPAPQPSLVRRAGAPCISGSISAAGQPVFTAWTSSIVPALRRRLSTISKPAASTSGSERRV
jgi:hypothetical protein